MSGYNLILKIRTLEEQLDSLGMMMCHSKHGVYRTKFSTEFSDVLGVKPKDTHSLPAYSRDAELFVGTIEALEYWLMGIEWARKYDTMMFGNRHNTNREKKEQDYRNDVLVKTLTKEHVNES